MNSGPLPRGVAWRAVARCVGTSTVLFSRGRIRQPREHVGRRIRFADGTTGRVYRETALERANADPCVLVVSFRLRLVRGRWHRLFQIESILNTPLFVGFPGFVSKLWIAHDGSGLYRGLYEWDGADRADAYARSLWRVLELVSEKGSVGYQVLPGLRRDDVLADPGMLAADASKEHGEWWRVVAAA